MYRGVSVLRGCPKIADVFCMEEILKKLGAKTWWEGHNLYLDCSQCEGQEISSEDTCKMRSSVILLGAVTARNKRGKIGYPGGCVIGNRPIDLHLYALRCLGAEIREEENFVEAECRELEGGEISFFRKKRRRDGAGDFICCHGKGKNNNKKLCKRAGNTLALSLFKENGRQDFR